MAIFCNGFSTDRPRILVIDVVVVVVVIDVVVIVVVVVVVLPCLLAYVCRCH